ncbi:MAG: hypothetical protein COS08_05410, partial [Euryarchaeota archaeon CG01_land_8_20_14_3_00_38_12]
ASSETWVEGDIYVDTTWTVADSPYIISKNVRVHDNATLTIDPGVEIKFGGDFNITVYGNLTAVGTEVNKIVFTSNKESPEKGDWDTIKFVGGENHSFVMEHCVLEYAKKGITCKSSNPGSKLGERSSKVAEKGIDNKYKSHIATKEDIENMKGRIGVRDQNKDYNIIIDGHGTGLAPPTEEEWDEMIGKVKIVDSVSNPKSPDSVDLSQEPYFPPVGDQGGQRSCASWATAYYTNGYLRAKDNNWTDASTGNTQHLISPAWVYNKVNGGFHKGTSFEANYDLMASVGSATLYTMPYDDSDYISWGDENAWREAPSYRLQNYEYVFLEYTDVIKSLINDSYPVNFAIDTSQYGNGFADGNYIISSAEYSSTIFNHAQTIVGYDDNITDDDDTGAFKVVNSWGADWGDNGFYWITYDAIKEIWYPGLRAVDKVNYDPSLLGVWELKPPCSRDASVTLGVVAQGNPEETRSPIWKGCSWYHYPSFMCLDITEFEDNWESGTNIFFLEIGYGAISGIITSFKVEHYTEGYVPGNPSEILGEASDVPMTIPGYVTVSGPIHSRGNVFIKNSVLMNNKEEGVMVTGNYNITIKNTTVSDNNGQGIYLDSDNEGVICNSTVKGNGINGIYLSNSKHIDISGNSISQNGENGVYVCGSGSSNITIESNVIEENGNEGIYVYSHGGYDVYYKNGNFVYTPHWWGSCYIQNIVISNNTISYNENGIHVYSYTYEFVKIEDTRDYIWTSIYSSDSSFISNTKILNNTISPNAKHGIFINSYSYAYADSSASGTFVSGSTTSKAYSQISNTTILNNNIFSNGEDGIYVYSDSFSCSYGNASDYWSYSSASAESYSAISNSVISGNTIDGVYFYSNSYSNGYSSANGFRCYSVVFADSSSSISDSIISDNTISSNEENGIYIQGNGFSSSYAYGDGTYAYWEDGTYRGDESNAATFSYATGVISAPEIFNNTICDNEGNGIYVYGYGSGDTVEEKNSYGSVYTAGYVRFYYIKISNSIISGNGDSGIKISMNGKNKDDTPAFIAYYSEITNNTISYHDNYGVYYSGIKNNEAHFNNIVENGFGVDPEYGRGMWIDYASYTDSELKGEIVNAEQNFWGGYEGDYHSTAVGPYHPSLNPNAAGNAVNGDGVNLDFVLPLTGPVVWLYIRPNASISIDKMIVGSETIEIVKVDKTTVGLNESIVFNASKSAAAFDSKNNRSLNVAYYLFNYGDGTETEWVTTWVVVHKYSSPGTYTINLRVKDEYGLESNNTASVNIEVRNVETAVLINGGLSSLKGNGTTIFYYNVTYKDKEGDIPQIKRVCIEGNRIYDNDTTGKYYKMGDMTWVQGENNTGALYSYNTILPRGEYKYYFVFEVDFEDWSSITRLPISSYSSYYKGPAVSVNYPPVANFTFRFFPPGKPLTIASTIHFADNSYDRDGYIISWLWDFGDGTTDTGATVTHKYEKAGTYTVTLTVTDNSGATNSSQQNIRVKNAAPTATNLSLLPSLPNTT